MTVTCTSKYCCTTLNQNSFAQLLQVPKNTLVTELQFQERLVHFDLDAALVQMEIIAKWS